MNNYSKILWRGVHKTIKILSIFFLLFLTVNTATAQDIVQKNQIKFGRLLRLVNSYYVDSTNVDKLTEKAIIHLLGELDPHSVYISKEEVEKMNQPLQGNFEGIGISFNIYKDTLLVTGTIQGGPSEKAGMKAGDRIIEIDNKKIAGIGLKNSDVFKMLRGVKGTTVTIKIIRKNEDKSLDFSLVRDKIPIYSLDASFMLNNTTGYIKLNKFSATTIPEFTKAMEDLKSQNIKNLILDLRGNGGGYLKTAIDISDQFINDNKTIVYTNGTNEPRRDYKATAKGIFKNGGLVVLVDETSASASEIVAGAIQDWDRGIIIGRRSFGKGLVQNPFLLTDGSMVRLTIAHYYTPSGRCIQKPYNNGIDEYRHDYLDRLSTGELFCADSISLNDSLRYKTLINKRNVYGGGGIMPDVFIPVDTSKYYQYYNRLRRNNIVYDFVLDYVDINREQLNKKYQNFYDFANNFIVTEEMVDNIVVNGEKLGISKNKESLNFTLETMKREIKALIARDLFSRNEFYRIFLKDDDAIKKAEEILQNKKKYTNLLVNYN